MHIIIKTHKHMLDIQLIYKEIKYNFSYFKILINFIVVIVYNVFKCITSNASNYVIFTLNNFIILWHLVGSFFLQILLYNTDIIYFAFEPNIHALEQFFFFFFALKHMWMRILAKYPKFKKNVSALSTCSIVNHASKTQQSVKKI